MNIFKNYNFLLLKILPFLFVFISFLWVYKKPLFLTESVSNQQVSKRILADVYSDKGQGGNSKVELLKNIPSKASCKYVLGNGIMYPYAGIIYSVKDSSFIDLSGYDYFQVKIKAKIGTRIPLALFCNIPNYSKPGDVSSYHHLQYMLIINNQWNVIKTPLKNFIIPNWWYGNNNKTEKDFDAPDFSKVRIILVGNCTNVKPGIEDIIDIDEISFHTDLTPYYVYSILFLSLYFVLWKILIIRKNRKSGKQIIQKQEIKHQNIENKIITPVDKDQQIVFNFIASNYWKPEITIIDVQNAIGIHERKISAIIKKKTNLNFKHFLNNLRVSEAKRLLLESNLQISEIASKSGYSNVSHFNRVFKSFENCSPNDFRKKLKIN